MTKQLTNQSTMLPKTPNTEPETNFEELVVKWSQSIRFMKVTLWLWMWPHRAGIHRLPIEAAATKCCHFSWFAAKCSRIFSHC